VTESTAQPVVLLIEDEENVRTLTSLVLQDEGYRVLAAETAADALRLVDEHRPSVDVILTDVVMPGATGPELVRQIIPLLEAPAVVYMSGYTSNALHELQAGCEFLSKPFSLASLRETLARAIATQRSVKTAP
jgi:CheY-like chemotaxis protein